MIMEAKITVTLPPAKEYLNAPRAGGDKRENLPQCLRIKHCPSVDSIWTFILWAVNR